MIHTFLFLCVKYVFVHVEPVLKCPFSVKKNYLRASIFILGLWIGILYN